MENSGILELFSATYAENLVKKTEYIQSEFSNICNLLSLSNINKPWILYIRMVDFLTLTEW